MTVKVAAIKWDKPAHGCVRTNAYREETRFITCYFSPDIFRELRLRAKRERTSVAEQIRTLVQWGLDSEGEA